VRNTSELIWQDAQHQTLFELIDQLKTIESGFEIFTKLNDYAESHFAIEEQYMLKLNYPRTKEHIRAHNKFREELKAMTLDQHKFDEQVRASISLFLREWLTRHIFGIDKDFEAFVLQSDYK
jgi:hemerythrin